MRQDSYSEPATRWLIYALVVSTAFIVTDCSSEQREETHTREIPPTAERDLSRTCDAALADVRAASMQTLPWEYSSSHLIGDEKSHPIGRVIGAAWDEAQHRLYVLDGLNGQVAVFDSTGAYLSSFGQPGKGPGEFEDLGAGHGSRPVYNQIAHLPTGYFVVNDLSLLHLFDASGEFIDRVTTRGAMEGPYGVRHIASVTDSTLLFAENGAMRLESSALDLRTSIRIRQAIVRNGHLDTLPFARISNNLDRLPIPPFDGLPPRDPYFSEYRRTWDAIPSGLLAIVSLYHHGVCFFDVQGELQRSYRIDAPIIEVDRAERARVLQQTRERVRELPPMMGDKWEDIYDVWPETAPFYVDIAMASDSVAWVERRLPGNQRMIDLFDFHRGYMGSIPPLGEYLPITFSPNCAFIVDEEVTGGTDGKYFYGLKRWCRRAS